MNANRVGHLSNMKFSRWRDEIRDVEFVTDDGVKLFYQLIGNGPKAMVLANGLGGRLYSWGPFLDHFTSDYTIICWDYRGLFDSETPENLANMSVKRHARDLRQILMREEFETATLVGWSMGVQVILEYSCQWPKHVDQLVLINGSHGHTLSSAFGPLFRVPYSAKLLQHFLEFAGKQGPIQNSILDFPGRELVIKTLGKYLAVFWGNDDLKNFSTWFYNDIFYEDNIAIMIKLLMELNAHSVYHHLWDIEIPTLIFSGGLDGMTPSYLSKEMAKRIQKSKHIHFPLASHFIVLEKSEKVIQHVKEFLNP